MKILVWACRLLYILIIGSVGMFFALESTDPVRALQAAAVAFIAFLLLIGCTWSNNHLRAARRARRRPQSSRSDEPPLSIGKWRVIPDELVGQPRWEHDGDMRHVVDGVTNF